MTKSLYLAICFVALTSLFASMASAQDDEPIRQSVKHKHSFTISPIHLAEPELFGSYEYKIEKNISVGVLAGLGESSGFPIVELGAKWSYYLIGSFEHGMPLTAELVYAHLSANERSGSVNLSGTGSGVYFGPTIGYKYISDYGLTLNLAAGIQYITAKATVVDHDSGKSFSASNEGFKELLVALVGWSF